MIRLVRACCVSCIFVLLSSCKSQQPPAEFQPSLIDAQGRPSLGYFKHRGEHHSLRDLMDPAYRASHDRGFARWFDPSSAFAHDPDGAEPRFITTWTGLEGGVFILSNQTWSTVSYPVPNGDGGFDQVTHECLPYSSDADVPTVEAGEPRFSR